MDDNRAVEKVKTICEKYCGKKIRIDEELIHSKLLNSFSLFEMICEMESDFYIKFVPEEIMAVENFATVENIVNILRGKGIGNEL